MEREYVYIEKWICENPDGTKVEIFEGDEVRVRVDENKVDLNIWVWGKFKKPIIDLRILSLSKTKFVAKLILDELTIYQLKPKDIIEITKLKNTNDNYTNKDILDMFPSNYNELDNEKQAEIMQNIALTCDISIDIVHDIKTIKDLKDKIKGYGKNDLYLRGFKSQLEIIENEFKEKGLEYEV